MIGIKAVIMAGGKGTRIASVNSDVPKPMIPILDKPILLYQIENLREQGIKDIVLVCGHLKHVISDYFGNGERFGVNISYIMEEAPLGTAGALALIKPEIDGDFLLINGDIIFNIDFERMARFHRSKNAVITLFSHPNTHPYDSSLLVTSENDEVVNWLTKENNRGWCRNLVNAGIHLMSDRIFSDETVGGLFDEPHKLDLDRDIIRPLVGSGKVYSYNSSEYAVDMGTPDRYGMVSEDVLSGKPQQRNLSVKQKAVFLDRDGTINKYVGFLRNIDQFELLPNAAEGIRLLNSKGYLVIVITNQPVIARGEVTVPYLDEIHRKMETLLGQYGAYINGLYYCPHHPDSGFEGEIPQLKIKCSCRKPNIGLVKKAADDYNIDLSESWFAGDTEVDVQTGKNAGCHTALISSEDVNSDFKDLLEFAEALK